jgi:membrane associated rhomboid family serine protease
VNELIQDNSDSPVWAREDAFPAAPSGWGWVDHKGKDHPCDSRESLTSAIRDDRDGSLTLVWAPGCERMILPEELGGMGDALRAARARWSRDDLDESMHKLRWFGTILAGSAGYACYGGWVLAGRLAAHSGIAIGSLEQLQFSLKAMLGSTTSGIALLMFVIFAFIPWWQARKRQAELGNWTEEGITEFTPTIRFETWLERQKAPLTRIFLALVALVALGQIFCKFSSEGLGSLISVFHNWDGTQAAGLVKPKYLGGDWWRLFTAPLLHGNIVHLLMNGAAMAYLGKRVEVFARWPHLPMVFLFAATIGGTASVQFIEAPSVGASGGLMGWLGFLLVFETLHQQLVPRRARRRLMAGVLLTALIGLIGYRYIDNAAHAGGLIAGMIYAAIVFPSSSSPHRPRTTITDRLAGGAAMAVIVASAVWAMVKIIVI